MDGITGLLMYSLLKKLFYVTEVEEEPREGTATWRSHGIKPQWVKNRPMADVLFLCSNQFCHSFLILLLL